MRRRAFLGLSILLSLAFVGFDSAIRLSNIRSLGQERITEYPPARMDPASPSGHQFGQHELILPSVGADGYQWILQTDQAIATRSARVHWVDYDNAPEGREAHWAGPLRWWATGLAAAYRGLHPEVTLPIAVERVAPWANTLLSTVLILGITALIAWRLGAAPASIFILTTVTAYPFYEYFLVGNFDHHALATLTSICGVLFIALGGAGFVGKRGVGQRLGSDRPHSWFAAAAVASAISLWINAATGAPILLGIGVAALIVNWRGQPRASGAKSTSPAPSADEQPRLEPRLWRVWGLVGAACSLAFYAIEYFPDGLDMRLEVNHPLYALAWLAGGDLLARFPRSRSGPGDRGAARRELPMLALDVVLLLLGPAVVLWSGDDTFAIADPFLRRLHEHFIVEFLSLPAYVRLMGSRGLLTSLSALPLVVLPAVLLLYASRPTPRNRAMRVGSVLDTHEQAALVVALVPTLLPLVLSFLEVRWLGVVTALSLVPLAALATVVTSARASHSTASKLAAGIFMLLCVLPYPVRAVTEAVRRAGKPAYQPNDVRQLATRDFATWLRARVGADSVVVFAAPTSTARLIYFGGFRGLGTLYWENLSGLRSSASLAEVSTADALEDGFHTHGVTHLALFSWDGLGAIRAARSGEDGVLADGILSRLEDDVLRARVEKLPEWLDPLYYPLPQDGPLAGEHIEVFEVNEQPSKEMHLVRVAAFLHANGSSDRAERLLEASLPARPNAAALSLLAQLQFARGDHLAFARSIGRLQALLGDPDDSLELADRMNVVLALGLAGEIATAKQQVEVALASADERGLRRTPPRSLATLIALASRFGLAHGREPMLQFATGLLPESERVGLGG
jgi:hypothetical protein